MAILRYLFKLILVLLCPDHPYDFRYFICKYNCVSQLFLSIHIALYKGYFAGLRRSLVFSLLLVLLFMGAGAQADGAILPAGKEARERALKYDTPPPSMSSSTPSARREQPFKNDTLPSTPSAGQAQSPGADTLPPSKKDSFFLLKKKGILGKLARSIVVDTAVRPDDNLLRIDLLYRKYEGKVIRDINVQDVDFGISINDTSRSFKNSLTRLADAFHHTTRENVIRNNLFFKKDDLFKPYLIADNERHLRDQVFLGDAKIMVTPVEGAADSVDILVLTKDVLSLGGAFDMSSLKKVEAAPREDNFLGAGHRLQAGLFYDYDRHKRFGYGAEYIARNIGGSFVDGYLGYKDYGNTFNTSHKEETTAYARLIKPLVNPYMKWTYAFEGAYHENKNMYFTDSLYQSDMKYKYYNLDAWIGFNFGGHRAEQKNTDNRLRTLIGLRFLHQEFQETPDKYEGKYNYQYANITGALGSMSIFRQDFYKTQYIYGFGRNEDVPEGIDVTITSGLINKQQRVRAYTGLDFQLNYFSPKKNYFNYTLRAGGYSYKGAYEDISLLFNLDFFSRLKQIGRKWKQRTFLNASLTTQLKKELNEPLLLESQYGMPEYENISLGGDHRLTIRAESVFYYDWSLFAFRFAPFIFGNTSFLTPEGKSLFKTGYYQTIGAGLRSRNESLVFGTLELKGYYFVKKNFNNQRFRVEFGANIKFKYNSQFIRRPEFIVVN